MVNNRSKIAVIDFGGQYAHLIASRVRRLGAYTEIVSPDRFTADNAKENYFGIIYSGGPASVYEPNSPRSDPELLNMGLPVLGICYGHQLIMQQLGGEVSRSGSREYGPAELIVHEPEGLFAGEEQISGTVWMSHGDEVKRIPHGFKRLASTDDCEYAAVGDVKRRIYGIQFHPEVTHTERGDAYLTNFIRLCGLEKSYSLDGFLESEIAKVRAQIAGGRVFLLISGGVDSTVAFALLAKALPEDHLLGLFVDTGFMRSGEIQEVERALRGLGVRLHVHDASALFYERLRGVYDPEKKRGIIGEAFIDIQERVTEELGLNPSDWFLGQGTIYPDTIESGATKDSHKIKTHHNRVKRIQEMIERGRVVEPIRDLYKDEVRRLGALLGLPIEIVQRHPFPGPGLAVRCLCTDSTPGSSDDYRPILDRPENGDLLEQLRSLHTDLSIMPVKSVGVQGDQRSYAHPAGIFLNGGWPGYDALFGMARMIPNRIPEINRVMVCLKSINASSRLARIVTDSSIHPDRMEKLRSADRIVNRFQREHGLYDTIWQFPVVLAPFSIVSEGQEHARTESIILRPVQSIDAMTATCSRIEEELLFLLAEEIFSGVPCTGVFLDVTSKPPGTIEWE